MAPDTHIGTTAIVTGAASGIGRSIADHFAAEGRAVLCADINRAGAEKVAATIIKDGGHARAVEVDVADEPSVQAMVDDAISWTGQIDALAANAGIMAEGSALTLSLEDWTRVMSTNATGAFLTARAALPHMIDGGGGAIVFTASTVALAGMKGIAAYSASKGAVVALTRQMAADYADQNIRVNAVAPGAVRTPLSESHFRARAEDDAEFETLLEAVIDRYPLKRWGTTAEIADLVTFLCSDRAGWMTGQIIPVDGGLLELR
ncbi:SDR family NAD(P)-dependent oxidoreductase [Aliiroseovarius sp. YM-037]|uniref:SDR family NAD(P)-dependent oxidoreductase n=1 Tax=Aliiroseovarius sp. YM-037 TaxID=3341728 RepID=UPI003A80CA46